MMQVTFQKTDGKLFRSSGTPKEVKDFWTNNKTSLKWCFVFDDEGQHFIWHEGHKYWQHLDRLDDNAKAVYRRLLTKYYTEAFNNGMAMEHIPSLDNQS